MAEKDPPPQPSALTTRGASSLSESQQDSPSPLPQWLDQALLRIATGIEGNTSAAFAIRDLLASAMKDHAQSDRRTEQHLADLKVEFDAFVGRLDDSLATLKAVTGQTFDARNDLKRGAGKLEDALNESKKFALMTRAELGEELETEGGAPKPVRVFVRKWSVKVVNVMWPITVRAAPTIVGKIAQAVGGSVVLAALAKILHFYATHAASIQ